jgi:hypothetical protein
LSPWCRSPGGGRHNLAAGVQTKAERCARLAGTWKRRPEGDQRKARWRCSGPWRCGDGDCGAGRRAARPLLARHGERQASTRSKRDGGNWNQRAGHGPRSAAARRWPTCSSGRGRPTGAFRTTRARAEKGTEVWLNLPEPIGGSFGHTRHRCSLSRDYPDRDARIRTSRAGDPPARRSSEKRGGRSERGRSSR